MTCGTTQGNQALQLSGAFTTVLLDRAYTKFRIGEQNVEFIFDYGMLSTLDMLRMCHIVHRQQRGCGNPMNSSQSYG